MKDGSCTRTGPLPPWERGHSTESTRSGRSTDGSGLLSRLTVFGPHQAWFLLLLKQEELLRSAAGLESLTTEARWAVRDPRPGRISLQPRAVDE